MHGCSPVASHFFYNAYFTRCFWVDQLASLSYSCNVCFTRCLRVHLPWYIVYGLLGRKNPSYLLWFLIGFTRCVDVHQLAPILYFCGVWFIKCMGVHQLPPLFHFCNVCFTMCVGDHQLAPLSYFCNVYFTVCVGVHQLAPLSYLCFVCPGVQLLLLLVFLLPQGFFHQQTALSTSVYQIV